MPASALASRAAGPRRLASTCDLRRAAEPRTPSGVQRQGTSTSCVRATAKRAPPPARRLEPEPAPEPLERRVERVEAGRRGREAAVLVPRAVELLDAGEVEERLCEVVAVRPLSPVHLLPGRGHVGEVVPSSSSLPPIVSSTQRARRSTLSGISGRGSGRRGRRTRLPGRRSSSANTASTYGGRWKAGLSPGEERDRPALPAPVHRGRREGQAEQVAVRDPGEVDTAGGGEPVPLVEARVDLHELVAPVARVALELDLREAVVAERAEEAEACVDDLLHPHAPRRPGRCRRSRGVWRSLRPLKTPSGLPVASR